MAQGTIAEGIIKIVVQGMDKLKLQLVQLADATAKVGKNLQTIGNVGGVAFAAASAGITKFVSAADPVRFGFFQAKLEILSMYIGRIFIQILEKAMAAVDRLTDYFKSLTPQQQDQIEKWAEVILAVTAFGAVLAVIVPIVTQVISVGRALIALLSIVQPEIGIVIGLLALLAGAWAIQEGKAGGFIGVIKKVVDTFQKFWDALLPLRNAVENLFDTIGVAVQGFIKEMQPVFDKIIPVIQDLAKSLAPVVAMFGDLLSVVFQLAAPLAKLFGEVQVQYMKLIVELVKELAEIIRNQLRIVVEQYNSFARSWAGRQLGLKTVEISSPASAGERHVAPGEAKPTGNHTPMRSAKPELIGIADVWKRLQTANQNDPKALVEKARNDLMKSQDDKLGKIVENTTGQQPAVLNW